MGNILPSDMRILHFVRESNSIESIHRQPTDKEYEAHVELWSMDKLEIPELEWFVGQLDDCYAGKRGLRMRTGMDVRVGSHVPPCGGSRVVHALDELLKDVASELVNPYTIHQRYEHLHPFMDGNGRSGRALWAWQMINHGWDGHVGIDRLFLHQYYYQSLTGWRDE